MKKPFILLLLFLISFLQAFSQEKNQLYEMINTSIEKFIEHNQLFYAERGETLNLSEVYLNTQNYPTGFEFSQKVKNMGIKIVNLNLRNHRNYFRVSRYVIDFISVVIHENTIKIQFRDCRVQAGRRWLHLAWADGATYLWEYSCLTRKWEFVHENYWGI